MTYRARCTALVFVGLWLLWSPAAAAEAPPSSDWPDLSGQWAVEQTNTAHSQVPVVGTLTSTTTAKLLVDIEQQGANLRLHSTTCSVDIEDATTLVRTILPDRFVNSIPSTTRRGRLVDDNGHFELQLPRNYMVHGARFDDIREEAMPDDDSDPRVEDQDGDGNPGVTVKIEGIVSGDIYVVQRSWDAWRGRIENPDTITGVLHWGVEQSILGASTRFLRIQPKTQADEDPTQNPFSMRRLDGGDTECRDLR